MLDFSTFVLECQKYFPDLQIRYKNESTWISFLGKVLFFNPSFATKYVTTIGNTVWFPSRDFTSNAFENYLTLLHELVHMHDARKQGWFFQALYLFPQILAVLFIPLLFFSWKLALLLIFLALLPWPAPFRKQAELRAYQIELYCAAKLQGQHLISLPKMVGFISKQFTSSSYYFMWGWPFSIRKEVEFSAKIIQQSMYPFQDSELFLLIDKLILALQNNCD